MTAPTDCAYCSNHALRKVAVGKYVRMRSPENIAAEVEASKTKFPLLEEVYLEVKTLGANIKWAMSLCSELEVLKRQDSNDDIIRAVATASKVSWIRRSTRC